MHLISTCDACLQAVPPGDLPPAPAPVPAAPVAATHKDLMIYKLIMHIIYVCNSHLSHTVDTFDLDL